MSLNISAFSAYNGNKKKTATKTTAAKGKAGANKKATPNKGNANKAKTKSSMENGKSTKNMEKKIDNIDELYNSRKPLNAKQRKEKKELEAYLISQLEMDDKFDSDEYTDESDSNEEHTTGASFAEYTMNSQADTATSFEDNEDEELSGEAFSLEALRKHTEKTNKRRNSEGVSATAAKQKSTTNGVGRKSLPAASAGKAKAKSTTSNQQRSVGNAQSAATVPKPKIVKSIVKLEPMSFGQNVNNINSVEEGLRMLSWLLNPVDSKEFFDKYWEKNVCLVKREQKNYYSHLISFGAIDSMLSNHHVEFTKNLDITSYKNGVRETLNPEGRALPPQVWDYYGQGCSLRLLNPQTFLSPIFEMNTTLQEYFHCMVGANVYLTPPNSQGFAPHYDDIEAFVLQIEGRKRWRLYKPRSEAEQLPRVSSANFKQNEIGKPILDEVMEAGDLLYFPRGTIHQACTEPGYHSLHITVSVYQKQAYADLFENMLPLLLKRAIATNVDMRRGLPLHTFRQAGLAFTNNDTKERADFVDSVSKLLTKTLEDVNLPQIVDGAVDMLAKRYQHEALPPYLMPAELARTIFGSRSDVNEQGECICDYEFELKTNIRLLRAHILRVIREPNDRLSLYFYAHNSKEYQQFEPNFIEINAEDAASIEVLLRSYPAYIGVAQLPFADDIKKIEFAQALWERGLLMLEKPLR